MRGDEYVNQLDCSDHFVVICISDIKLYALNICNYYKKIAFL